MKEENYKRMTHDEFLKYIDKVSADLEKYINENNIKVDYICPVLRSGGVPAVYISNKLNIIKFAPFQVKHIKHNDGRDTIEVIYNPLDCIKINKEKPVFLIVEAMHSTGYSVELCINEIKNVYKDAIILYASITKAYGYKDFSNIVNFETTGFYYNRNNKEYTEDECKNLGIEFYNPLFPWEDLQKELSHPDDLEDNIFF